MARNACTVGKLYVVDNSYVMGREDESDAARCIKLNAWVLECSLINAVDEVFESGSFFDVKCKIFAVGFEIESDSRGRFRAEAENVGKRVKGVDLTLLHLVKADAVILLFDIDRADG